MFARLVEFQLANDAALEFLLVIQKKVLPTVKSQRGCIDAFVLVSETDRRVVLGLSLWNSQSDAEQFQSEVFEDIERMLRHLLRRDPTISIFEALSCTNVSRSV
jgi:quinol monooxygenase YgiN